MRYGVISDIHGNLHALRAAVAHLEALGVERWLCAGDIVGYGPHPNECIDLLGDLEAVCVAGNHDLMAVDRLPGDRGGRLARWTTSWTRSTLSDSSRTFLACLPLCVDTGDIVVGHGSLDDPECYVRSDRAARRELDQVPRRENRFLVLGHTHQPWLFSEHRGTVTPRGGEPVRVEAGDATLVNPGSVGQSRQREAEPRARFGLIDTDDQSVQLVVAHYDVEGCLDSLARHGMPLECIHLAPTPLRAWSRRARRAWEGGPR